jgi:hypothetical protein
VADPLSGVRVQRIETEAIANLTTSPGFHLDGTATEDGSGITLQLSYKLGTGCAGTVG